MTFGGEVEAVVATPAYAELMDRLKQLCGWGNDVVGASPRI